MMNNTKGGGMMKQVMQLQKQLKQAQKDLEKETVTGSAGEDVILVKMTGSQKCTGVTLDKEKNSEYSCRKTRKIV